MKNIEEIMSKSKKIKLQMEYAHSNTIIVTKFVVLLLFSLNSVSDFVMSKAEKASSDLVSRRRGGSKSKAAYDNDRLRGKDFRSP